MSARVILVDDHNLVRRGLKLIVERGGLTVVGEGATGAEAIAAAEAHRPEVAVVDIHLPDLNGIEVARRLLERDPGVKVIMLTAEADERYINQALQVGAMGYILKETAPEELMRAIEAVLAGRPYLCPEASEQVVLSYRKTLLAKDAPPSKPALSERERQVLRLIADGLRNKEIADRLGVSIKTAETYRARLCAKLGVSGTAELVRYALRNGIAAP